MSEFEFDADLQRLAESDRPEPSEVSVARARLRSALREVPETRPVPWRPLASALGVVAASLAVAVAVTDREDAPLPLTDAMALSPNVYVEARGRGEASTHDQHTEMRWWEGHLRVQVTPDRGEQVEVTTPEATVAVRGTVFTVDHGPFGTVVGVERGEVEVACSRAPAPGRVRAGDEGWCFRDAGVGLGRVLWLEGQNAAPDIRLAAIRRAVAHPVGLAATRSLLVRREVDVLVELGRTEEALSRAQPLPEAERQAALSAYAEHAMDTEGCAAAEPFLRPLAAGGDETGGLLLVQCLAESDPAGAHAAIRALDAHPLSNDARAALDAWKAALGPR
ncbi:MAG: FecR family protein [Myxococcota bacterium]